MPTIKRASTNRSVREPSESFKPIPRNPLLYVGIGFICLLIIAGVWYSRSSATSEASSGAEDVAARVRELAYVSSDADPTIATINDAERLRAQNPNYYRDAENGDKLLIWNDLVVLYSASRDRILALQPITTPEVIDPVSSEATGTEAPTAENPLIQVRNGSGTPGRAREVSTQLAGEGLRLLDPSNAAKTYPSSIILIAPGKSFPQTVAKLRQLTGATVGTVDGEAFDQTDIVLIVGSDAT